MNKVDYEENGWHSPPTVLFVPIFIIRVVTEVGKATKLCQKTIGEQDII